MVRVSGVRNSTSLIVMGQTLVISPWRLVILVTELADDEIELVAPHRRSVRAAMPGGSIKYLHAVGHATRDQDGQGSTWSSGCPRVTVRVGSRALNGFLAVRGGAARVLVLGRSPPREALRR